MASMGNEACHNIILTGTFRIGNAIGSGSHVTAGLCDFGRLQRRGRAFEVATSVRIFGPPRLQSSSHRLSFICREKKFRTMTSSAFWLTDFGCLLHLVGTVCPLSLITLLISNYPIDTRQFFFTSLPRKEWNMKKALFYHKPYSHNSNQARSKSMSQVRGCKYMSVSR